MKTWFENPVLYKMMLLSCCKSRCQSCNSKSVLFQGCQVEKLKKKKCVHVHYPTLILNTKELMIRRVIVVFTKITHLKFTSPNIVKFNFLLSPSRLYHFNQKDLSFQGWFIFHLHFFIPHSVVSFPVTVSELSVMRYFYDYLKNSEREILWCVYIYPIATLISSTWFKSTGVNVCVWPPKFK